MDILYRYEGGDANVILDRLLGASGLGRILFRGEVSGGIGMAFFPYFICDLLGGF